MGCVINNMEQMEGSANQKKVIRSSLGQGVKGFP